VNVVDPNVTLQLLNTMGAWGKVVDTGIGGNDETGWQWFAATSASLECLFPLRISANDHPNPSSHSPQDFVHFCAPLWP